MSNDDIIFKRFATEYDPIKIGSIDATDTVPHDRAIVRAINSVYIPNKLVKGDPLRTLFIGRLNPRTTQAMVEEQFSEYGEIQWCRLVKDIVTGKSKRYAFLEYKDVSSVEHAIYGMNKETINRSEILLEREAARRLKGWRPRRLGGGFGGMKESGQLRFGCTDRPWRKPIHLRRDDDHFE